MGEKKYLYRKHELYVKEYQAVNSTCYAVFFRDTKGFERRLTFNNELGVYETAALAQSALDAFAECRKLEAAA